MEATNNASLSLSEEEGKKLRTTEQQQQLLEEEIFRPWEMAVLHTYYTQRENTATSQSLARVCLFFHFHSNCVIFWELCQENL